MSTFPSSPTDGQIAEVANVRYQYTTATNSWTRIIGGLTSLTVTGNIVGGNLTTAGNVTGNYILGNGALLTGVITSVANINNGTSNVTVVSSGGNVTVGVGGTSNVAVFAPTGEYVTGEISATGNIIGGGVRTTTSSSAPSTPSVGDMWFNSTTSVLYRYTYDGASYFWEDISGGALAESVASLANGTSNISVLTSSNVTVGVAGSSNVAVFATTGEYVTGVVSASGNITGSYILGNGSQLTGLPAGYANSDAVAYASAGWAGNIIPSANSTYTLGNATNQWKSLYVSNTTIYIGNVAVSTSGGNLQVGNNTVVTANATGTSTTQGNVSITGNVTANYVLGNGSLLTGIAGGPAWQSVQTGNFTAGVGNAYPIDTTSSAITITLPASPGAGNVIILTDYKQTFGTNPVTLVPNGGKIYGNTSNILLNNSGESVNLVYIDSTQGWIAYSGFTTSPVGSYVVSYLAVAGGGSGGLGTGYRTGCVGGGGAGGLLTGSLSMIPGTAYTITIGAGGAAPSGVNALVTGSNGSNTSIGGSVTTVGGGGGGNGAPDNGRSGGSGGGGGYATIGGSGTNGQGYGGGAGYGTPNLSGGGGGGAGSAGSAGSSGVGGNGGAGVSSSISGSSVTYAGGGGAGGSDTSGGGGTAGSGGSGGGGAGGAYHYSGTSGTSNSGGGGGGSGADNPSSNNLSGGAGGSGVVIISYAGSQRATGGTVTTSGGNTIHTFTTSGTYTA